MSRARSAHATARIPTPRPRRHGGLASSVSYGVRLGLLTLFGPATQDAEHDPIVALKREYGRPLAGWERPEEPQRPTREQTIADIRETQPEDLGRVWAQVHRDWGEDASRIWQEAFSAEDASDT